MEPPIKKVRFEEDVTEANNDSMAKDVNIIEYDVDEQTHESKFAGPGAVQTEDVKFEPSQAPGEADACSDKKKDDVAIVDNEDIDLPDTQMEQESFIYCPPNAQGRDSSARVMEWVLGRQHNTDSDSELETDENPEGGASGGDGNEGEYEQIPELVDDIPMAQEHLPNCPHAVLGRNGGVDWMLDNNIQNWDEDFDERESLCSTLEMNRPTTPDSEATQTFPSDESGIDE